MTFILYTLLYAVSRSIIYILYSRIRFVPADSAESDSLLFTGGRSPNRRSLLPSPLRPGRRSVYFAQYSWSQGVVSFGWSASCLSRTVTLIRVARILPLAAPGFCAVSHGRLEVLVDPDDGEAVATAMVLSTFLQPKMMQYSLPLPIVLPNGSEVRAEDMPGPKSSWALICEFLFLTQPLSVHNKLICLLIVFCAYESRYKPGEEVCSSLTCSSTYIFKSVQQWTMIQTPQHPPHF